MANRANPNDVVSLREALIDILVEKGILTQEELMTKIEKIRKKMPVANS